MNRGRTQGAGRGSAIPADHERRPAPLVSESPTLKPTERSCRAGAKEILVAAIIAAYDSKLTLVEVLDALALGSRLGASLYWATWFDDAARTVAREGPL